MVEIINKNAREVSALLKALSNEKRLEILCALYKGEKSVGELEVIVGLSQSALSQHLARLRKDQLVATRRQAQTVFYSMQEKPTRHLLHGIQEAFLGRVTAA